MPSPTLSREEYERLIYTLPAQYPLIRFSTLVLVPPGMSIVTASGLIGFVEDIVLCVYEILDFAQQAILTYSYETSRSHRPLSATPLPDAAQYCRFGYPRKDVLYWYDSQPHPKDPTLASTHPHHKHIPPNIKHHRVPAPKLSFTQPNLPFLIEEIERELLE
jgi:hypothetical protein